MCEQRGGRGLVFAGGTWLEEGQPQGLSGRRGCCGHLVLQLQGQFSFREVEFDISFQFFLLPNHKNFKNACAWELTKIASDPPEKILQDG